MTIHTIQTIAWRSAINSWEKENDLVLIFYLLPGRKNAAIMGQLSVNFRCICEFADTTFVFRLSESHFRGWRFKYVSRYRRQFQHCNMNT